MARMQLEVEKQMRKKSPIAEIVRSIIIFCLSVCPSVCLTVHLSVRPSVCLSVHLSVCLLFYSCPVILISSDMLHTHTHTNTHTRTHTPIYLIRIKLPHISPLFLGGAPVFLHICVCVCVCLCVCVCMCHVWKNTGV